MASVSWGDACPIGFFADSGSFAGLICEASFVSGEPTLPFGGRFSRLIGKFDTTDYRAAAQGVCENGGTSVTALEPSWSTFLYWLRTHETPLVGVAFRVPALVTGLPANYGRWLNPPRLPQALPAGLPLLWRLLLPSVCCCLRARRNSSSSRYITGTQLDSNRRAVSTSL